MPTQLTYATDFIVVECCNCGIPIPLTKYLSNKRLEDGEMFWCANGHGQHFTESVKTKLEKAQKKIAQQEADLKMERQYGAQVFAEAATAKRRLAATKGVLTKERKRTQQGQCPLCLERFPELAHHMQDAHPDYNPAAESPEETADFLQTTRLPDKPPTEAPALDQPKRGRGRPRRQDQC